MLDNCTLQVKISTSTWIVANSLTEVILFNIIYLTNKYPQVDTRLVQNQNIEYIMKMKHNHRDNVAQRTRILLNELETGNYKLIEEKLDFAPIFPRCCKKILSLKNKEISYLNHCFSYIIKGSCGMKKRSGL